MTHTTEQPEALRLAIELEQCHAGHSDEGPTSFSMAAEELRRLHARNQELEAMVLKEVQHSADQRRRADQLEQQHAMQAKMHAQACEQLAAQAQREPLPLYQRDTIKANAWRETMTGGYLDANAIIDGTEAAHGITQEKQG